MAKKTKRADGRYSATLTIGVNPNGTQKKKYFYGKTIHEAEEKRDAYKNNLRLGINSIEEKASFYTVALKWLYTHLSTIKKNMSIDALNTYINGTIKDV